MIRILVVLTKDFKLGMGITTVAMNFYKFMCMDGIQMDFACNNDIDESLDKLLGLHSSKYYKLPPRKNLFSYYRVLKRICKDYDIVHVHGNSPTTFLELYTAKSAGVKHRIVHNHNSVNSHPILNKFLESSFRKQYTFPISCSDLAGDWLFGRGCYTILNNAIDLSKYAFDSEIREKNRTELNISKDDFVIGCLGKLNHQKNHRFAILLFFEFLKVNPNSRLLIIGDGVLRDYLISLVSELGLNDKVIFTGSCNNVQDYLQSMDIFVFPSLFEGFPLSVVEAQANGLPCILSDHITKSVSICSDVCSMSIDNNDAAVQLWAEKVSEYTKIINRINKSKNNIELLTQSGLDIRNEANKLREIYLSMMSC